MSAIRWLEPAAAPVDVGRRDHLDRALRHLVGLAAAFALPLQWADVGADERHRARAGLPNRVIEMEVP